VRLLAVAAAVLALAVTASSAGAQQSYRYPRAFERAFMANCNATSGGMTATCRCALRWLERHYSYRRIIWLFVHDPARMRRISFRAISACRG
jgi:hypothetical protein